MRRTAPLVLLLGLSSCTGFGEFLDHAFSVPGSNPNISMGDSENVRRALGLNPPVAPLQPEPGNIWPGPPKQEPTLADIEAHPQQEDQRGFPPTTVPGGTPGLPDHRQPRPARGSSTPPGSVEPGLPPIAVPGVRPVPNSSPTNPSPFGRTVPLPNGPGTDTGGTTGYRQLNTPSGPGAIIVPNGNGTSTVINPNGTVQTIPTPR